MIERGTFANNTGYYEKWSSGKLFVSRRYTAENIGNDGVVNSWYYKRLNGISISNMFVDVPRAWSGLCYSPTGGTLFSSIRIVDKTTVSIVAISNNNDQNIEIDLFAEGRRK